MRKLKVKGACYIFIRLRTEPDNIFLLPTSKKCSVSTESDMKFEKNKSNRVRTTDVFRRTARLLVFESSFNWHTFLFLMLFCSNSAYFSEIRLVCGGRTDRPTDRPTNRRTDGRTDTPFYRDARTHLKRLSFIPGQDNCFSLRIR